MNINGLIGGQEEPQCQSSKSIGRVAQVTVMDSMQQERDRLSERLHDVNAAIKALEENPKILEVLELINKVRNRY